jgi:uncharacterized protein YgiM (DUF1202 family)
VRIKEPCNQTEYNAQSITKGYDIMKKNIITTTILTVTLVASLALTGCGNTSDVDSTETLVESTEEAVAVDEDATEEAFVEGEDLSEESTEDVTEDTEAEDAEAVESEAESEDSTESAGTSASASYTYADMSKTMYAKSSVNVRDLPSTDGNKLGGLSTNQEVTVTGQCNETGWYAIEYKGSTGYVSNKYLSDEKVVAQSSTGSGSGSAGSTGSTASAGTDASATASAGSTTSASTSTHADGFDRSVAEAIWAKVNAERSAAGLNTLVWDEAAYSYACGRAQAIVNDYSHNGNTYAGENIAKGTGIYSADGIHQCWHDSTGHYNNYMASQFASGACAVYYYNGNTYAVEDFSYGASKDFTIGSAEDAAANNVDVVQNTAPSSNSWTASNGVTVYICDGYLAGGAGFTGTMEEWQAACDEYYATH